MSASHIPPDTPAVLSADRYKRAALTISRVDDPEWRLPEEATGSGCTRLIVLVPDGEIDSRKLIQELADMAAPPVAEIVFVGLGQGTSHSGTRRRLDGLVSEARQHIAVVIRKQVVEASSWIKAAQIAARPGDLIVCHTDQRAGRLGQELEETTPFPVHQLEGLRPTLAARLLRGLGRLCFEVLPLVIVAAFFWLQVQIDTQVSGLAGTLVIVLTVLAEIGLIFVWSLFIPR